MISYYPEQCFPELCQSREHQDYNVFYKLRDKCESSLLLSWLLWNGSLGDVPHRARWLRHGQICTQSWGSPRRVSSLGRATDCSLRQQLTFGKGSFVIHFCQWHIRRAGVHQEHLLIVAELKFGIERIYNWHGTIGLLERNGYQEPRCRRNENYLRAGSTLHGHVHCLLCLCLHGSACCGCWPFIEEQSALLFIFISWERVLLQDICLHCEPRDCIIYWKNLFLVVVWFSPSTHLSSKTFLFTVNRIKKKNKNHHSISQEVKQVTSWQEITIEGKRESGRLRYTGSSRRDIEFGGLLVWDDMG